MSQDWEADPRPFSVVIKAWRDQHGWSRSRCAAELRAHPAALDAWFDGSRAPGQEKSIRRLMVLIDREGENGA